MKNLPLEERAIFIGDPIKYSSDSTIQYLSLTGIYATLNNDPTYRRNYYATDSTRLLEWDKRIIVVALSDLMIIPKEEWKKYEIAKVKKLAALEKEKQDVVESLNQIPKGNYKDKTYNISNPANITTGYNYVSLGTWDKKNNSFVSISDNYMPSCCSFTKTSRDLSVFIPDIWMYKMGYNHYDLVEWLKFLSKCDIGFEYQYNGIVSLPDSYKVKISKGDAESSDLSVSHFPSKVITAFYKGINGKFHNIYISHGDYNMKTYLKFICLRYIYNDAYYPIPGHAMQIKNALGNAVTHWEALLMAHLHSNYYGYYNLVSQSGYDPNKGAKEAFPSKDVSINCKSNFDAHVNPFQSYQSVITKANESGGMNTSFSYVYDTFHKIDLDEFFTKKDWIGLYKYCKSKINAKK